MTVRMNDDELIERRELRDKIALIIDANYHTAISKALSTADQIINELSTQGKQGDE